MIERSVRIIAMAKKDEQEKHEDHGKHDKRGKHDKQSEASEQGKSASAGSGSEQGKSASAGSGSEQGKNAKNGAEQVIKDFDNFIFRPTDIPETPIAQLVEELSEGLSTEDAAFMMEAATELRERLAPKRFAHSISVSRTAKKLAQLYGSDVSLCTRAGLVHDWDKCYRGQAVFDRAVEMGIELGKGYEHMEALFHSITGAKALERRFPGIDHRILQAVARHTSGAVDMSDVDMIVYISDMIEPLRTYESLDSLRELVGKVDLRGLFSACFKATIEHLIQNRRYLHPDSAAIWNEYVAVARGKSKK